MELTRRSSVPDHAAGRGKARQHLERAADELQAYFRGSFHGFGAALDLDAALDPHRGSFAHRVWRSLTSIPAGSLATYGEIARLVGAGGAARAVGGAVGANPLPILVPCHRVVGSGGRLTGFSSGLRWKILLLEHEGIRIEGGGEEARRRAVATAPEPFTAGRGRDGGAPRLPSRSRLARAAPVAERKGNRP